MQLEDKLQFFRKRSGFSQEQLADKLGVSRQTISKWENGQAVPEIDNLVRMSNLYRVTIDRIVKNDERNINLSCKKEFDFLNISEFLIRARLNTYAQYETKINSTNSSSRELQYNENELLYRDTFLGTECFHGEEIVSDQKVPIWRMNYSGRVLSEQFSENFLKEALSNVTIEKTVRGPNLYQAGEYCYHCRTDGIFTWFHGIEDVYYENEKIYEGFFLGGIII